MAQIENSITAPKLTEPQRAYLHFMVTGERLPGGWSGNPSVVKALRRRGYIKLELQHGPSSCWKEWRITDKGRAAYDR